MDWGCNDYVSRADVLEITAETGALETQGRVKELPAADVRTVVRGIWLTKEYMYGEPDAGISDMWIDRRAEQSDYYAYCSNCGKDAGYNNSGDIILSDYCPNCGADMRCDEKPVK